VHAEQPGGTPLVQERNDTEDRPDADVEEVPTYRTRVDGASDADVKD